MSGFKFEGVGLGSRAYGQGLEAEGWDLGFGAVDGIFEDFLAVRDHLDLGFVVGWKNSADHKPGPQKYAN